MNRRGFLQSILAADGREIELGAVDVFVRSPAEPNLMRVRDFALEDYSDRMPKFEFEVET